MSTETRVKFPPYVNHELPDGVGVAGDGNEAVGAVVDGDVDGEEAGGEVEGVEVVVARCRAPRLDACTPQAAAISGATSSMNQRGCRWRDGRTPVEASVRRVTCAVLSGIRVRWARAGRVVMNCRRGQSATWVLLLHRDHRSGRTQVV